jgi:putative ATP-binding cassette transporter
MTPERRQMIQLTVNRFRGAIRMLVQSDQGTKAVVLAVTLVVMMIAINGLNVLNSYVGRDFMSAIENKNFPVFRMQALMYVLVFAASTVVAVLYRFTEERLGILWREQLTWRLTEAYLSERTYYRLDSLGEVANPDQRISEDVRAFTTTTLSFTLLILNGTMTAISFSGVLWSISPAVFAVAVLYAVSGTAMTILLGKPLIRLNYHQLDMEANFRSDLIHVRENAESIALAHREGRFKIRLRKRLDLLATNYRRLIRVNRNLGFFTNGYNYFIQIIPALIVAPRFIFGEVEFGVITQSTMAFATLLGAFSLIVTQFQSISAFTAVTARLHLLSEGISKAHKITPCSIEMGDSKDSVSYQNVTLKSLDDDHVLVEDLSLEVRKGSRWLFTSNDDAPKVALFRSTAGIWDCGSGRILRPGLDDILFLPERPYLPPGTLRDVLLRTGLEHVIRDSDIDLVLHRLGVKATVERVGGLNASRDWDDVLSIGEQHMLSVARIFLARPAIVYLDRPGSALPKSQISMILEMLTEQGIGVVVLAKNGESRLRYDSCLEIRPDGKWEVRHDPGLEPHEEHSDLRDLSC